MKSLFYKNWKKRGIWTVVHLMDNDQFLRSAPASSLNLNKLRLLENE